jgi:hypothetical protein
MKEDYKRGPNFSSSQCMMNVQLMNKSWLASAMTVRMDTHGSMRRLFWVKNFMERREESEWFGHMLMGVHRAGGPLQDFLRGLDPVIFYELVEIMSRRRLRTIEMPMSYAIAPGLQLCMTLRHLAVGESYADIAYMFLVPRWSVSKILPDVCAALIELHHELSQVHDPKLGEDPERGTFGQWVEAIAATALRWQMYVPV